MGSSDLGIKAFKTDLKMGDMGWFMNEDTYALGLSS